MTNHSLQDQYRGKKVLITGHTGFKGSWLSLMLNELKADVIGYALAPEPSKNHFTLTSQKEYLKHIEGDIRDFDHLKKVILENKPDIVFHLAAQALVFDGYNHPKETFDVNAGGTVNLLEALRLSEHTKAAVIITTDKCYENKEWLFGYRENDTLGGKDPYSASKSMAELASDAYRSSFFNNERKNPLLVATARAGNIIGGGDFSPFRIIPDCMKALSEGHAIEVRSPNSTRPWLYILDALKGYLKLGSCLLAGNRSKAEAWNFGPLETRGITVKELAEEAIALFGEGSWKDLSSGVTFKEMPLLKLNWDKAAHSLDWAPSYNWKIGLKDCVEWERAYRAAADMRAFSLAQIQTYNAF